MRNGMLAAVVFSAQMAMACTIGAPAMNDAEGTASIVEQLSVSSRENLPECTAARDAIRAYIRADAIVATCSDEAWHDPSGNVVDTTPAADAGPTDPPVNAELPGTDAGGTVAVP